MSSVCTFLYPIFSDLGPTYAPAISGGSWSVALPAVNVQSRDIGTVARSTDATAANTTMVFDLGVAQAIGALAILIPNVTKSATPTVRWKLNSSNSFASPAYDSAAVQCWPTGVTKDQVTAKNGKEAHVWSIHVPASTQTYRYVQIVATDTANADGHLDFARIAICGTYVPSHNFSIGAHTGHEDDSTRDKTDGGAALYQPRTPARVDTFGIANTTPAESLDTIRDMQFQLGLTGQLGWMPDPSDTTRGWKRNYFGVLKELSPIEYVSGLWMGAQFSIIEDL